MYTNSEETLIVLDSVAFRTEPAGETPSNLYEPAQWHERPLEETPFDLDQPPQPQDRIADLERKLDTAIRMMSTMQQRIESLDTTLMRVLMR